MERAFEYVDDIATLKERNAVARSFEADGFTVKPGGRKPRYTVTAWKGEAPDVTRHTFNRAGHTVAPLYRRADGNGYEYLDGSPERD